MAKNKVFQKWLVVILVIAAVLLIWKYYKIPDQEEEVTEQIEEIDWEEIDKIVFLAGDDVQIIREGNNYLLLTDSTRIDIDNQKVARLFESLDNLQNAELKKLDFRSWQKDTSEDAGLIRLYHNTEEVLNLYLQREENYTYFRYLNDSSIYQAEKLPNQQLQWLDSLSGLQL